MVMKYIMQLIPYAHYNVLPTREEQKSGENINGTCGNNLIEKLVHCSPDFLCNQHPNNIPVTITSHKHLSQKIPNTIMRERERELIQQIAQLDDPICTARPQRICSYTLLSYLPTKQTTRTCIHHGRD